MEIPDLIRTKINLLPPDIHEIRIVEIVGVDLQADGGTHVRETSEVGSRAGHQDREQGQAEQAHGDRHRRLTGGGASPPDPLSCEDEGERSSPLPVGEGLGVRPGLGPEADAKERQR